MLIKYTGGRSHYEVSLNRKAYYFTKENNRILDIKEKEIINYIFSLPNRAEFEVVVEPQEIVFNQENNTVTTGSAETIKTEEPKIIKKMGRPKKGGKR